MARSRSLLRRSLRPEKVASVPKPDQKGGNESDRVSSLHADLDVEFERLQKLGKKFSVKKLTYLAQSLMESASNPKYAADIRFGKA